MSSPTSLSLAHLRKTCLVAEVVEKWVPNSPAGFKGPLITRDLCGFDIFAIRNGEVLLVQTTSRPNMNARIKKLADLPSTEHLRTANIRLLVHGWAKRKVKRGGTAVRNELVEVDIS